MNALMNLSRAAVFGAGALAAVKTCLFTVDAGHRAVIFDRIGGIKKDIKTEGLNFYWPILQKPIIYEVRTKFRSIESDTGSRDLQTVHITLRILYRPDIENLPQLHSSLGPDYDDRVLPSIGNEVLKAVVAQYDAGTLITQREDVSGKIVAALTQRAAEFNIILDDVSITHLTFSPEFTHAIEAKQVAQQIAERSKYVVARSEQEKKAAIIKASGEAEAAYLISKAVEGGTGFIELRKIEAAKEIVEALSRTKNVTFTPSGSNVLLGMDSGRMTGGSNNSSAPNNTSNAVAPNTSDRNDRRGRGNNRGESQARQHNVDSEIDNFEISRSDR
eukprot:TRINITY_DN19630_c0_g1_i1.p1 TRINITY_DN19630_c0_g1~~TRINITY_DN19630_c0_g1_i1.p1  ORF type:complete len:346 (-),score=82.35 TRINITY_DN19630_c0_g1_i1:132-1124(-)